MIQGEMVSDVTIELVNKMAMRGSNVKYIAASLHVSKAFVYKVLSMTPEQYEADRQRRKAKRQESVQRYEGNARKTYKDYLPKDQWESAEKFLHLVWRLKRLANTKVSIDLTELRKAYQALPELSKEARIC